MKLMTYAAIRNITAGILAPFPDGDVLAADRLLEFSLSAETGDVWRLQSTSNTSRLNKQKSE